MPRDDSSLGENRAHHLGGATDFARETDVSVGEWITTLLSSPEATNTFEYVPRGFPAYARIFHPVTATQPERVSWGELAALRQQGDWPQHLEFVERSSSWKEIARLRGVEWSATILPEALLLGYHGTGEPELVTADGWRIGDVAEGDLGVAPFAALTRTLEAHTSHDRQVYAAVWEGWGSVIEQEPFAVNALQAFDDSSSLSRAPGLLTADADPAVKSGMVAHSPFSGDEFMPEEGEGGTPQFELLGRDYLLFQGELNTLTRPDWTTRAGWVHDPELAVTPALLWPEDHSWILVTEIDSMSSIVGGSHELMRAVLATEEIEAEPLTHTEMSQFRML